MIVYLFNFRLFFSEKPCNHIIKRFKVIHNQRILLIDCNFLGEKLLKHISGDFDYVFGVHVRSILKATYDKQKDIFSFLNHFDSINIASSYIEKASDIFKNLNENESEFI